MGRWGPNKILTTPPLPPAPVHSHVKVVVSLIQRQVFFGSLRLSCVSMPGGKGRHLQQVLGADLAVPVELVHNCNQAPALPAHGLPLALKLVNKPQNSASVQSGAGTGWLRKGTACLPTTQT